ncbi:MAG: PIN/TRAM domain-containing protein [Phycisphaeraceae bacterium]
MILFVLRGLVLVIITAISVLYLLTNQEQGRISFSQFMLLLAVTLGLAVIVIAADTLTPKKKLSAISGVFIGLMVGLVVLLPLAYVVDLVGVLSRPGDPPIELTLEQALAESRLALTAAQRGGEEPALEAFEFNAIVAEGAGRRIESNKIAVVQAIAKIQTQQNLLLGVKILLGVITCYFCISLVLQTKDDFRFIIPYVEFTKQIRGNRPAILDTSVIVDGRILDIIETQVMQGIVIVPRFVLDELQVISDSSDKLKRARGRRGLDILQKLQAKTNVEVHIEERDAEGINVDQKLIDLAHQMQGRVMTNDFNLNKIAELRGVDVININDLAKALRPVVLPGEHMTVKLVKPGESPTQGIGYLDDGTMVVVENGRSHLDHDVDLIVTSTLQTSAGRMIFGKFAREEDADNPPAPAKASPPPAAPPTQREDPNQASGPYPPQGPRKGGSQSRRNPRRG